MNKYIFITNEGITYQPNSKSIEPDCENAQIIGFSYGNNQEEAFDNLLKENTQLEQSSFHEIYCYQVKEDISKKFYIN